MEIRQQISDASVLSEVGRRLAQRRLNLNRTQEELAESSGVSKRTVERLEKGQSVQLSSFIRVCRELGLVKRLESLIEEPLPSPIAQVKLQGRMRRRATSSGKRRDSAKKWTWGETP